MRANLFIPFCIAFMTLILVKFWNGRKNLPPGPWVLPLLGHLVFLGSQPHRTLMTWKKKYGPIISGQMGSFPCVFLCDPKIIKQAFGMVNVAGRGEFEALVEKKDKKGLFFNEGPRQTEQRHFALTTLKDFGVGRKGIEGHIQDALGQFLDRIKTQGENGDGQRAMDIGNISSPYVFSSLYRVLLSDELTTQEVERIGNLLHQSNELGPVISVLAIFMPWIETLTKLVTLGRISVIKERQNGFLAIYRFIEGQVEKRKVSWIKGQPRDVVDAFMDMVDKTEDVHSAFHPSRDTLPYFITDLVIGGVHTTSTTMEWMFLYVATFPSVQKKLQEEIGRVVGSSRLPALCDRPQMPYVDAAINELLRLSSITPLGIDHRCTKEVNLQGYRIPKGTLMFANIYGVHHDPEIWGEDAEEFKPERWLGDDGRKLKSGNLLAFSTGKRSCIGETFAKDTLFIFVAGIFQRFTLGFEKGCQGPGLEPGMGMSLVTKPFKLVFTPRHL